MKTKTGVPISFRKWTLQSNRQNVELLHYPSCVKTYMVLVDKWYSSTKCRKSNYFQPRILVKFETTKYNTNVASFCQQYIVMGFVIKFYNKLFLQEFFLTNLFLNPYRNFYKITRNLKYYYKFPSEFEERNNKINQVVNLPGKIRRDAEREGGECPRYPIRERVPKGIHRTNDQIACLSTSEQPNFQKIINQRYIRSAVAVVRSMVNGYQIFFSNSPNTYYR